MKMKCHFVPGVSKSCKGKLIRCAAGLSQKHCKKQRHTQSTLINQVGGVLTVDSQTHDNLSQ